MIKRVDFMSMGRAAEIEPDKTMALISIREPGESPDKPDIMYGLFPYHKWEHKLCLYIWDIDEPIYIDAAKTILEYDVMDVKQAAEIIYFVKELPETIEHLIVHCHAGISRSAAVAKWVDTYFNIGRFPSKYSLYNKHVYSILTKVANVTDSTEG